MGQGGVHGRPRLLTRVWDQGKDWAELVCGGPREGGAGRARPGCGQCMSSKRVRGLGQSLPLAEPHSLIHKWASRFQVWKPEAWDVASSPLLLEVPPSRGARVGQDGSLGSLGRGTGGGEMVRAPRCLREQGNLSGMFP